MPVTSVAESAHLIFAHAGVADLGVADLDKTNSRGLAFLKNPSPVMSCFCTGDIFDHIDCQVDGYYSYDEWNTYSDMSSDNVLDYDTAMCFIEELVDTYGWDDFHSMLVRLNKYQTGELDGIEEEDYLGERKK